MHHALWHPRNRAPASDRETLIHGVEVPLRLEPA
jgi:hypothetical protein